VSLQLGVDNPTVSSPLRGDAGGIGLGNYRVVAALILIIFVALYLTFR